MLPLCTYTQPTYLLDAIHYRDMFVSDTFVSDTFICMLMLSIARLFNVTKNVFDCRKFMWVVDEEPINQRVGALLDF